MAIFNLDEDDNKVELDDIFSLPTGWVARPLSFWVFCPEHAKEAER